MIEQFEQVILENMQQIEVWFSEQWRITKPLVTCSVDLRRANFKLAPVDTNVFPS